MDRPAFELLVEKSLEQLPKRFKSRLHNIIIEVEDRPSQEVLDNLGIKSGTLFGLYQGVPLTSRGWNYGNVLPDRIVIYQHPIESAAASSGEIERLIRDTVMHEIGHYFGFTDAALYSIDREKRTGKGKKEHKKA
ncbi:MAG TPA: metallopeptidase family protein [Nitrospirota bacterium]|nr:metallopeptidase family protein [Nitrospirota bacterium]